MKDWKTTLFFGLASLASLVGGIDIDQKPWTDPLAAAFLAAAGYVAGDARHGN